MEPIAVHEIEPGLELAEARCERFTELALRRQSGL
jgi:hypothetical protein